MEGKTDMPEAKKTTVTITLEEPIVRGTQKITELTLRRPNAGALRGVSIRSLIEMEGEAISTLLPRISEPPLIATEVAKISPPDLLEISLKVTSFFMKKADREKVEEDSQSL